MHLQKISLPTFLTKVNPKIKFLYFCGLLLLTLSSKNPLFLVTVFFVHFFLILSKEIKLKEIFHIYLEPLFVSFLLVSIKSIDFYSFQNTLFYLKENLYLGLRVLSAFTLFLTFYASLSFFELIKLMKWLRIPSLFQELLFLSVKFITLLKEDLSLIYVSQKNRLGYWGFKRSLNSLKYLVQASFFKALRHSQNTLESMQQRGFDFKNLALSFEPLRLSELFYLLSAFILWTGLWISL